jgi:hypothetical protein
MGAKHSSRVHVGNQVSQHPPTVEHIEDIAEEETMTAAHNPPGENQTVQDTPTIEHTKDITAEATMAHQEEPNYKYTEKQLIYETLTLEIQQKFDLIDAEVKYAEFSDKQLTRLIQICARHNLCNFQELRTYFEMLKGDFEHPVRANEFFAFEDELVCVREFDILGRISDDLDETLRIIRGEVEQMEVVERKEDNMEVDLGREYWERQAALLEPELEALELGATGTPVARKRKRAARSKPELGYFYPETNTPEKRVMEWIDVRELDDDDSGDETEEEIMAMEKDVEVEKDIEVECRNNMNSPIRTSAIGLL